MSYVEAQQSLGDHPKTIRLGRLLGVTTPQVVGHLLYLWWWAQHYATSGDLTAFEADEIAAAARWKKDGTAFVDALVSARFLDRENGCLQVHDWADGGGKLFVKRRKDADRKREERGTSNGQSADVQRTSNGHPTDGARTLIREDKKRVEGDQDTDGQAVPPPIREMRDWILSRLPAKQRNDGETWASCESFARTYQGQNEALTKAYDACVAAGEVGWPRNLAKYMPKTTKAEPAFDFVN